MIQMENVTKQYANGVTAIKDLNLKSRMVSLFTSSVLVVPGNQRSLKCCIMN